MRAPRRAGAGRVPRELREGRGRGLGRGRGRRGSGRGPVGRSCGPRAHASVGAQHARQRVLDDEGHDGAVRAAPGRRGPARSRRAGRALLARVRAVRQGTHPGARPALPPLRSRSLSPRGPRQRANARVEGALHRAREAAAALGARKPPRLPRGHVRPSRGRSGAPYRRPLARPLLPRRDRGAPRRGLPRRLARDRARPLRGDHPGPRAPQRRVGRLREPHGRARRAARGRGAGRAARDLRARAAGLRMGALGAPHQHARVAPRRGSGRERTRQRALGGARVRRARARRRARWRARAVRRGRRAREHRAQPRARRRALRAAHPLRARLLHDAPRGTPRPRVEVVRAPGGGWLGRLRRSGREARLRQRDEPDAGHDLRGLPRLRADRAGLPLPGETPAAREVQRIPCARSSGFWG